MRWIPAAVLFICLMLQTTAAQDSAQAALTGRVEKLFEKWAKPDSPGCALSVIQDGKIVYEHGFGMADLDHDISISPGTVFHVASVSKQFTATSIVLLAQRGKLSLDDEVRKYIPELPDFGPQVTIRHLLHHTSGLRDQWTLLGLAGWRYSLDLITDDDVLAVMARQHDLNFPPGDRYLYCNTGYTLLAQIVKRVSGQSFREFTTASIFGPLGMKNTHFRDDHAEIVKNMAYGYMPSKETFKLSITNFDTVGATSLLTTVEDLALWDQNFYEPRVGGKAVIDQLLQRGKLNNGEQLDYAFGLTLGQYKGLPVVDHAGADAGYRADLLRFPEQHFSVACLCNLGTINPSELTRQVADVYLEGKLKVEGPKSDAPTLKLSESQLSPKAGIYHNPDGDAIRRIIYKDGALRAARGDNSIELKALSETQFRPAGQQMTVRFEDAGPGKPMRLVEVPDGGKPDVYERVEEFTPTAAQMQEYAGIYVSDEIEPLYRIAVREGKLVLERLKSEPTTLQPATRDLFSGGPGTIRFTRDPNGSVSGFILNAGRVRNFRFDKRR